MSAQQTRTVTPEEMLIQLGSEKDLYAKLSAPFAQDAYSVDSSRGFNLTSIKAQYIVERLNEVLGIGGWRHIGKYEVVKSDSGETEGVLFHGELLLRLGSSTHVVQSVGYSTDKSNKGDEYKGAKTDALSKAASYIGVGNEVFKGLVDPATISKGTKATTTKTFTNGKATFGKNLGNGSAGNTTTTKQNDPFA